MVSRSTSHRRSAGAVAPALSLVILVAAWALALAPSPAHAEDEYSREFLRALRRFLGSTATARAEGERALRRLGKQVMPQIARWIEKTRTELARLEGLRAEIDPAAGSDDADERVVRDFFTRKLDEGWRSLRDGDHDTARRIAEALEALDPDTSRVYDYRRLLRASQKRLIRSEVLEPAVEFVERVYEVGTTPSVRFRLINRQVKQLVIRAERGILGTLEISYHRSFIDGSNRREVRTMPVTTLDRAERIVLPARREYARDIAIEFDEALPPAGAVARLSVVGKFRPSQWGVGRVNVSETLELPETECWIVPESETALAEDPIRRIEMALIFRNIGAFFAAGQLAAWAAEEDPEMADRLVRVLVAALDELDAVGFEIADGLLRQTSGVSARTKTDPDFWRDWLRGRPGAASRPRARPRGLPEPPRGLRPRRSSG